jgi:hypothetical protein
MEPNHKLTLYISYYLARFNNEALANLGYQTWNAAFDDISNRLDVKSHSVKNWRDEFDPLFGHRAGWYQRPMTPSRVKVAQALEDLTEVQIRELVKDILSGKIKQDPDEEDQLLSIINDDKDKIHRKYVVRTPTGRAAEEFFIQNHLINGQPKSGNLIDCRDLGSGYDFIIQTHDDEFFIEVKGLTEVSGGVLFTDKEWRTAMEKSDRFILCIVKNLQDKPAIYFIANPYQRLKAKKNIYTTIQINWSISENEIGRIS